MKTEKQINKENLLKSWSITLRVFLKKQKTDYNNTLPCFFNKQDYTLHNIYFLISSKNANSLQTTPQQTEPIKYKDHAPRIL